MHISSGELTNIYKKDQYTLYMPLKLTSQPYNTNSIAPNSTNKYSIRILIKYYCI